MITLQWLLHFWDQRLCDIWPCSQQWSLASYTQLEEDKLALAAIKQRKHNFVTTALLYLEPCRTHVTITSIRRHSPSKYYDNYGPPHVTDQNREYYLLLGRSVKVVLPVLHGNGHLFRCLGNTASELPGNDNKMEKWFSFFISKFKMLNFIFIFHIQIQDLKYLFTCNNNNNE